MKYNFGLIEGLAVAALCLIFTIVPLYNKKYDKEKLPDTVESGIIVNKHLDEFGVCSISVKGKNVNNETVVRYVIVGSCNDYHIGDDWEDSVE